MDQCFSKKNKKTKKQKTKKTFVVVARAFFYKNVSIKIAQKKIL